VVVEKEEGGGGGDEKPDVPKEETKKTPEGEQKPMATSHAVNCSSSKALDLASSRFACLFQTPTARRSTCTMQTADHDEEG